MTEIDDGVMPDDVDRKMHDVGCDRRIDLDDVATGGIPRLDFVALDQLPGLLDGLWRAIGVVVTDVIDLAAADAATLIASVNAAAIATFFMMAPPVPSYARTETAAVHHVSLKGRISISNVQALRGCS
jgi:hypothetical protein